MTPPPNSRILHLMSSEADLMKSTKTVLTDSGTDAIETFIYLFMKK